MATFERGQLPVMDLPTEEVTVDGLPGAVLVRGMDMSQLMHYRSAARRFSEPQGDETDEQAQERAGVELVPLLLSLCVVLDDGLPVYTAAQWSAFAARHLDSAVALFNAAMRLSGQDESAEKKA
jgi:hypothetical protein